MAAETNLEPFNVNVRIKISASWTAMLFVFAYVDLFSLYRRDVRADLGAGEISGFTVNQSFLLGTTAYVVIPGLMVFCALILRPRVSRIANISLGIVYALTIIAGDRRVGLLHLRQRHRGRTTGGRCVLRLDLAEGNSTSLPGRRRGHGARHPTHRAVTRRRPTAPRQPRWTSEESCVRRRRFRPWPVAAGLIASLRGGGVRSREKPLAVTTQTTVLAHFGGFRWSE